MGIKLTGISSPSPAIIVAVNFWTNSGALAGTSSGRSNALVTLVGTFTSKRLASVPSTAAKLSSTTFSPFFA